MQTENGHQVLKRNFLFKISGIRELVTKREKGRDNRASYFLFYHAYGDGLDSLIQICNQLSKGRIQGSGLLAA